MALEKGGLLFSRSSIVPTPLQPSTRATNAAVVVAAEARGRGRTGRGPLSFGSREFYGNGTADGWTVNSCRGSGSDSGDGGGAVKGRSRIAQEVLTRTTTITNSRIPATDMRDVKVTETREVKVQAAVDTPVDQHTTTTSTHSDAYANISTLPLSAALAASASDSVEVNGTVCNLLDRGSKKQVCLFYCDETEDLARRIAAQTDSIELRSIKWGCFPDGFPNIFVPNAHGIRSQHVAFLASFSSPGVIFEQLSIIYALPRMFVTSFTLVLPFFPTGTLERMEDEGDIATAFTLARILSNIPISRGGPTSLVIFDIHALQERFYFGDNVLPCFESGIPLLKHRLHQLPDAKNVTIAFPDEGAWKRFYKQLQHFPTIICTKVRQGDQRIVRLKEGDPRGRHVVIVDDLVQSGGTLVECQKLLESMGASKVSAYATHGVFPKRSWERFAHSSNSSQDFAHFWITDSCPLTVKEVLGKPPFEILSLAGSIAAALHI